MLADVAGEPSGGGEDEDGRGEEETRPRSRTPAREGRHRLHRPHRTPPLRTVFVVVDPSVCLTAAGGWSVSECECSERLCVGRVLTAGCV